MFTHVREHLMHAAIKVTHDLSAVSLGQSCKRLHQPREAQGGPRDGSGKSREGPREGLRESQEESRQDSGRLREGTEKVHGLGWE